MTARARTGLAVGQLDTNRMLVARESHGAPRHHEPRAELLRLRQGARSQRLAGDARGEAEVVLDFRARGRLAAWRPRLDEEHVEALGGGVDRRCQAPRPGATDDQVANRIGLELRVEAEAIGDLGVGGVSQDALTPANEDGDVFHANVKLIEERLHVRVALDVHIPVRLPVSHEERLDSQCAGRMRATRATRRRRCPRRGGRRA